MKQRRTLIKIKLEKASAATLPHSKWWQRAQQESIPTEPNDAMDTSLSTDCQEPQDPVKLTQNQEKKRGTERMRMRRITPKIPGMGPLPEESNEASHLR
jgi:hypothetical protein